MLGSQGFGVQSYERVFLFLRIQKFYDSFFQKVLPMHFPVLQLLRQFRGKQRFSLLHYEQRPSRPAFVAVHENLVRLVEVRCVDSVVQPAAPAHFAQFVNELMPVVHESHELPVQKNASLLHFFQTLIVTPIFLSVDSTSSLQPTVTCENKDKLRTKPQLGPSGVSFGSRRPQWVPCKSLAL